jgi:hypothetical protein
MTGVIMGPTIAQFLNRTILVSIPGLFEGDACRPFKLLGIEAQGLWLQSEELSRRLLSEEMQAMVATAPAVFVPFTQIAGVVVPTKSVPPRPSDSAAAAPKETAASRRSRTAKAGQT